MVVLKLKGFYLLLNLLTAFGLKQFDGMVCNNPKFEDESDDEAGVLGLKQQPKPKPQLQPSNVSSSLKCQKCRARQANNKQDTNQVGNEYF